MTATRKRSYRRKTSSDKLEEAVRKQMTRRFKPFKITELLRSGIYRSWFCADPESWDCSFTVTTIPGHLIVTGDLGDLIVARCYDMLPWCRGSCESTGYFAEKVPHGYETEEFSPLVLEEWIKYEIREIRQSQKEEKDPTYRASEMEKLNETLDAGLDEDGEGYFRRELEDVYDGSDAPSWSIWTHRFLVLREAVRWFVRNHSEPVIIQKESE